MNNSEINHMSSGQNPLLQQAHLSDYLAIIGKRKWLIIFSFLTIVGLATLYSLIVSPTYKATAQILLEAPSSPMEGVGEINVSRSQDREDYFQLIYRELVSRKLAREVADRTNIHFGGVENVPRPNNNSQTSANPYYTAKQHLNNLRVTPVKGYGLISISVFNHSSETAAWLANLHAEVFIEMYHRKNRKQVQEKFAWISRQINTQKVKLEQSYQKINTYQKKHGLISNNENSDFEQNKLMALTTSLNEATTEKEVKDSFYQKLTKYSDNDQALFSISLIAQDPIITGLRNKQILLREKKAEMATAYGAKHSKMIELRKKERSLAQQITNEVQRVILFSKEEVDRAVLQEKIARNALEMQKRIVMNLKEKSNRLDMLKREVESNQAIYNTLLAQSKKVNLSSMFERNNIDLRELAGIPFHPAKPKIKLNILLAIVSSLFLGIGSAFFVEYMDKKVRTPDDIVRYLHLPVLGVLPFEKNYNPERILVSGDLIGGPPAKDSYSYPYLKVLDWLPDELQLGRPGEAGSVLLMESSLPQEGKTTVLAKIAVRLGKAGFRVLAADCDFQLPNLHTFFAKDSPDGFVDALHKIAALDLSTGKLNECSVSDLYNLIEFRKLSGRLTIANEGLVMMSLFENGRLMNIESIDSDEENRLGTMLLKGGFLTESQLRGALERNKRTGQPLGYILINTGNITQEQLRGHLKLQTEEHLQKLFSWKKGTYEFEPESIRFRDNEKIYFKENYDVVIKRQSHATGSLLFEDNINALVQGTDYENVHFIAAGNNRPERGDPIDLRLLNKFIEIFRDRYDLILIDAPPVLEASDSAALAQLADGVLFVVKSGHLTYPVLHEALQRIAATNTEILGAVLNQVKAKDITG